MKKTFFITCVLFVWVSYTLASESRTYPYPFNPIQGLLSEYEKDHRQEICLNGSWDFMPVYQATASDFQYPASFQWESVPIKIPSPWNVNAFTNGTGGDFVAYPSYPKAWESAKIGWMRKNVDIPVDWKEKTTILHFEAVMGNAYVYVNGQEVARNFELFLPFEVDVSEYLIPGKQNEIIVGVAKGELFDDRGKYGRRTYVGGSMWGIEMAGIWQDVYLTAYPQVYIHDTYILPDVKQGLLTVELEVKNTTSTEKIVAVAGDVKKWHNQAGRAIYELPEQKGVLAEHTSLSLKGQNRIKLPANSVTKIQLTSRVSGELDYWTPENPNLYGVIIDLQEKSGVIDRTYERFGWRQFDMKGDRLLLNGKEISLKGDSWHFMGVPQMTRRYAWAWFNMLKDANGNAVRLHAQPFPRFYLDVADEMGICVLDETGIWSSDGGPKIDSEAYWESCAEHLRRLIRRDRNHASVFGWSVCNETIPVAVHVFKAPEEFVQKQVAEINRWVAIAMEMDPTRPWISGDGETDRATDLPTIIGHYGGDEGMQEWASQGKPWGIGEQGMAYYGTPKQASAYNGDRSYESMLGRMEAVAVEGYDLIKKQRELHASYSSIFNLAWYGLQPLELGMSDITRSPNESDGIFFSFKEGGYGMQPERLGPYTTTLNPGYDPTLPLYRPWPLFDAVRSANATPIEAYSIRESPKETIPFSIPSVETVCLFASTQSPLREELENRGVRLTAPTKVSGKTLLIIDGAYPPEDTKQWAVIEKIMKKGATVYVSGITEESLALINRIAPYPIRLEEREANSFLVQGKAPLLQGLGHADFYFSELLSRGKSAMHYGLSGYFVAQADVQLRACNTNWQHWNYRPETSKTGYVFRSEREAKGSDVVIASVSTSQGDFIVSLLDLSDIRQETSSLTNTLLSNLGVQLSNENIRQMGALDDQARLNKVMVCATISSENGNPEEMLSHDYIDGAATIKPTLSTVSADKKWSVIASNEGVFELPKSERDRYPVAYLSFWIYSPRSLSNLLAEPDMPSLDMFVDTNADFIIYLNGEPIKTHINVTDHKEVVKIPHVMPDKGWNHFMIKLVQGKKEGRIQTAVSFDSADRHFMRQVLSSVTR